MIETGNNYTKVYTKIPSMPRGIGGLVSSYDGTDTFYYYDSHLGNVNMITDDSANIVKTYNYDAFGNVVNEMGTLEQRYLYKTKEKTYNDNLVYFGARYYDPLVGRFTTPDPMGMIDGPNIYLYCNNDPVNYYDEWGIWVYNGSNVIIYVKPEKTYKDPKCNVIALMPGEMYWHKIDGFTTADGRVIKVRDKWWNPFTPNVIVDDNYSEVRGIVSPLSKELKSPPDDDWNAIFEKAKEIRKKICNEKQNEK